MWLLWKVIFPSKQLGDTHYTVHNGQKDHKCDSCGKTFSLSVNLKKHINSVHNGQKDHKCDLCGKSFSQSVSWKTHTNSVHKS